MASLLKLPQESLVFFKPDFQVLGHVLLVLANQGIHVLAFIAIEGLEFFEKTESGFVEE